MYILLPAASVEQRANLRRRAFIATAGPHRSLKKQKYLLNDLEATEAICVLIVADHSHIERRVTKSCRPSFKPDIYGITLPHFDTMLNY